MYITHPTHSRGSQLSQARKFWPALHHDIRLITISAVISGQKTGSPEVPDCRIVSRICPYLPRTTPTPWPTRWISGPPSHWKGCSVGGFGRYCDPPAGSSCQTPQPTKSYINVENHIEKKNQHLWCTAIHSEVKLKVIKIKTRQWLDYLFLLSGTFTLYRDQFCIINKCIIFKNNYNKIGPNEQEFLQNWLQFIFRKHLLNLGGNDHRQYIQPTCHGKTGNMTDSGYNRLSPRNCPHPVLHLSTNLHWMKTMRFATDGGG